MDVSLLRLPDRCTSARTSTTVRLVGERNSGTRLLQRLLERHLINITVDSHGKHACQMGPPKSSDVHSSASAVGPETVADHMVVISKNPHDFMLSLWNRAYGDPSKFATYLCFPTGDR